MKPVDKPKRPCVKPGCRNLAQAKGYCLKHYIEAKAPTLKVFKQ